MLIFFLKYKWKGEKAQLFCFLWKDMTWLRFWNAYKNQNETMEGK